MVVCYRRFGRTYRSHLQESRFLDCLTREDGTGSLSRNVKKQTTIRLCVKTQKSADLIHTATEVCSSYGERRRRRWDSVRRDNVHRVYCHCVWWMGQMRQSEWDKPIYFGWGSCGVWCLSTRSNLLRREFQCPLGGKEYELEVNYAEVFRGQGVVKWLLHVEDTCYMFYRHGQDNCCVQCSFLRHKGGNILSNRVWDIQGLFRLHGCWVGHFSSADRHFFCQLECIHTINWKCVYRY